MSVEFRKTKNFAHGACSSTKFDIWFLQSQALSFKILRDLQSLSYEYLGTLSGVLHNVLAITIH